MHIRRNACKLSIGVSSKLISNITTPHTKTCKLWILDCLEAANDEKIVIVQEGTEKREQNNRECQLIEKCNSVHLRLKCNPMRATHNSVGNHGSDKGVIQEKVIEGGELKLKEAKEESKKG